LTACDCGSCEALSFSSTALFCLSSRRFAFGDLSLIDLTHCVSSNLRA
jgi:hypothetical protein